MAIDAGILITDDVTKFCGGTPSEIYAVITEPAMVEKPEVMDKSKSVLQWICYAIIEDVMTDEFQTQSSLFQRVRRTMYSSV